MCVVLKNVVKYGRSYMILYSYRRKENNNSVFIKYVSVDIRWICYNKGGFLVLLMIYNEIICFYICFLGFISFV